jgi:hypothetical protein
MGIVNHLANVLGVSYVGAVLIFVGVGAIILAITAVLTKDL